MNTYITSTVIKQLRENKNLTQSELAELLFVSPQMVSRYENNGAAPDIAMLAQICQIFHVSMDTLCGLNSTSKDKQIFLQKSFRFTLWQKAKKCYNQL